MANRLLALASFGVCAVLPLTQASAAGFQLREGDPDWLANSFAGSAAKTYDAGTAWNNPAGTVLLDSSEIDSGVNYFDPGIRFSGDAKVNDSQIPGGNGGDAAPPAVTAGSEAVLKLSPDWALGLAIEAPYGLRTAFPGDFSGRYQALVSAIENFEFAFSAAYKVSDNFSIGGGPVFSYFRARLTQAINVSAFFPHSSDPIFDVRGDSTAAGYHLGAMYQITSDLRIGADYHSRLGQALQGKQWISLPPQIKSNLLFASILGAFTSDVKTQITLPDYATISAEYDVTPDLSLFATGQWTDWSLLPGIAITPASKLTEYTPLNLRNTGMGSIGANWRPPQFSKLLLQTGLLYDEGSATDITRDPRLPDEDRIGASAGFAYQITPSISVRVAYLHEFPGFGDAKLHYSNGFPNAGTIIGSFANDADLVSAGVTMKF